MIKLIKEKPLTSFTVLGAVIIFLGQVGITNYGPMTPMLYGAVGMSGFSVVFLGKN